MTNRLPRRRFLAVTASLGLLGVAGRAHAAPALADRVVVLKRERMLVLERGGREVGRYFVALGRYPVGPKTQHRDSKTPEGVYTITGRSTRTNFHRTLYVSYPHADDRARASTLGVSPGGGIAVHGVPPGFGPYGKGQRMMDWTDGCIALSNADMFDVWLRTSTGIPIEIRP